MSRSKVIADKGKTRLVLVALNQEQQQQLLEECLASDRSPNKVIKQSAKHIVKMLRKKKLTIAAIGLSIIVVVVYEEETSRRSAEELRLFNSFYLSESYLSYSQMHEQIEGDEHSGKLADKDAPDGKRSE
jgi:hypothetical protein